jgi:3-oxoacyl-[acyl-carrier protein] reductase
MKVRKQIALVTGSSRGIGKSIALQLANAGAIVIINSRHASESSQSLLQEIQTLSPHSIYLPGDVTQPDQAESMMVEIQKRYQQLDILVNNASGYSRPIEISQTNWESFKFELSATYQSVVNMCRAGLPLMINQKYGRIINLGATFITRPARGYFMHTTAKTMLWEYTRELALEAAENGITVNMVSPGLTLTENNLQESASWRDTIQKKTPMGRLATPEDIAHAVLFYASLEANYITGTYLAVDGGLSHQVDF